LGVLFAVRWRLEGVEMRGWGRQLRGDNEMRGGGWGNESVRVDGGIVDDARIVTTILEERLADGDNRIARLLPTRRPRTLIALRTLPLRRKRRRRRISLIPRKLLRRVRYPPPPQTAIVIHPRCSIFIWRWDRCIRV
jgi:hypothetical protein